MHTKPHSIYKNLYKKKRNHACFSLDTLVSNKYFLNKLTTTLLIRTCNSTTVVYIFIVTFSQKSVRRIQKR